MNNIKTSTEIMSQQDYKTSIELINQILAKTNIELGSVKIGQRYALYYKEKFNAMLGDYLIDMQILDELKNQVRTDLDIIRIDCNRRVLTMNVADNNHMISMILDFILSL